MTATIQDVIDTIMVAAAAATPRSIPRRSKTVDTITQGDPSQPITGIVSTFMATDAVIDQAIQRGANLIISHETIVYNHADEVDWLQKDPVYAAKRQKIQDHGLVVCRFHDALHDMRPDMTVVGLIDELGWDAYRVRSAPFVCKIPPMTLKLLGTHVKDCLHVEALRVVGNLDQRVRVVAVSPGFAGRERHYESLSNPKIDAVICGELHEWETSEYVRDAAHMGHDKALIVTGHAQSEEPGMRCLVLWLQALLPGIPVEFIPTGNLFHWL